MNTTSDFDQYCELRSALQLMSATGKGEEYISFLRFCVKRLERGDSVQKIWSDYQQTKA